MPKMDAFFGKGFATGWMPSPVDRRDYHEWHPAINDVALDLGVQRVKAEDIPSDFDLEKKFPAVRNQGALGSCCAFAGIAILEYLSRNVYGVDADLSERALYKMLRNLLGWTGDTGGYLRVTMAAMRLLGAPPEKYWKYSVADFDDEVPGWVAALARNFRGITYFRHDADPAMAKACVAMSIRKYIAAGLPSMAGFAVFDSYNDNNDGSVPMPSASEKQIAGHAICLMGYSDSRVIRNPRDDSETTGAFKFRNSWGRSWGTNGYGWIPYEYVTSGYMRDAWCALTADVANTKEFGI